MNFWPVVRRPVYGSWRRRTMRQQLVWRKWSPVVICCWRKSRVPWLTLPSHSSVPAMEHRASLLQQNPDPCFHALFLPSSLRTLKYAACVSEWNVRGHTVSHLVFGYNNILCVDLVQILWNNVTVEVFCSPEDWSECLNIHPVFCMIYVNVIN